MKRLLQLLLLLAPLVGHAQQLHIFCDHVHAVNCTMASPGTPTSAWDPLWLQGGKNEANWSQWFGVSGLVKSNGPSAAPTAATAADAATLLGAPTGVIKGNGGAAMTAATASDVATTVNGLLIPRTAAEVSAGVTPSSLAYPMGDVRRYGAVGDGVTDDSGAIQNALNVAKISGSRQQPVLLAGGANYRLASGITIPPTVYVRGEGASPDSNVGWATRLTCDLAVPTCVTIGQSAGTPGAGLEKVSVWRAAGTIPGGSIGILVLDGTMVSISHVNVMRHAIGVEAKSDGAGGGLGLTIDDLHVGIVSDAYFVQDTWAEVRIINSRFGSNGNDITANTYVRFQGGSVSGGGPNTFYVSNTQFNASPTYPSHWLDFVNQTASAVGPQDFTFANVHVEGILASTGTFIHSDSTWPNINGLAITNSWFSPDVSGTAFLALNAATLPQDWHISHNYIGTTLTLAPNAAYGPVELAGNNISGAVSVTGVGATHYSSVGNYLGGTLTYAGNFERLRSDDQLIGAFTWSATGSTPTSVDLTGSSFAKGTWTPALTFGGGNTGITYSRQAGTYQIVGNMICGSYQIILTAVGSSTGAVLITGLPYPSANQNSENGGGGPINFATGMASLSGPILASVNQNASTMPIWGTGSTGTVQLGNGNFTSTSNFAGVFCYEWQ